MTYVNGAAGAEASVQKDVFKRLDARVHLEPSLALHRIPRCPSCGAGNPQGLEVCESCGADAPAKTDYQHVTPVLMDAAFPWHSRALLWVGVALMRFAKWLQRS